MVTVTLNDIGEHEIMLKKLTLAGGRFWNDKHVLMLLLLLLLRIMILMMPLT